jgi:hypothetical protein
MLSDKLPPRVQHLVKKGEKAIVIWDWVIICGTSFLDEGMYACKSWIGIVSKEDLL